MGELRSDPAVIVQALELLTEPGQVVELRILNARKGTTGYTENHTGYFDRDHLAELARATTTVSATGYYFTLNPVNPDLQARAYNRLKKADKGDSTSDKDIVHRINFLIDLDVERPAGISSTDEEKAAAWAKAILIRDHLTGLDWPEPVVIDSGNGFHLVYRIGLPTDDAGTVKRCLEALGKRFNDPPEVKPAVHVDLTVANAARISKLPGTPVRKGDSTPTRPHRLARLVSAPQALETVPTELLEALAGPVEVKATSKSASPTTPGTGFNLDAFMSRYFPDATGPSDAGFYEMVCPWRPEDGRTGFVGKLSNGGLTAGCNHATCPGSSSTGNHWRELRAMKEPPSDNQGGAYPDDPGGDLWEGTPELDWIHPTMPLAPPAPEAAPAIHLVDLLLSGPELGRMEIPEREMIVEPFIATGSLNMVYAVRGLGKTFFGIELCKAVTTGRPFFEWYVPAARNVLFLDGEMPTVMLQERFNFLYGGNLPPSLAVLPSEAVWTNAKPLNLNEVESQERIQAMLDALEAQGRKPALIIIDNLSSLSFGTDENDNSVQDDLLRWLMGLRHQGYAVLLVHHAGKGGAQRGASRREDFLDPSIKLTKPETETQGDGAAFKIEFTKERGRKAVPNFLTVALETGQHGEAIWARPKTMPEYMKALLLIQEHHPVNYTALSKLMDISRQAATNHVGKLREKGYVHPMEMALTAKGTKAIAALNDDDAA